MSTQRPGMVMDFLLDESLDPFKSYAVQVPQWARYASLFIPALTENSVVGIEVMQDDDATAATLLPTNDTGWITVRDSGESAQVVASGVENCWIDCTEFILSLPKDCHIRLSFTTEQESADSICTIAFRGA